MKLTSLTKIAIKEALKSNHKQKTGAVIFSGKRIISVGFNQPFRSVKTATFKYFKRRHSLHAEIAAILKAKCNLRGKSILVVRINNKNELRNSKPCQYCQSYLEFVGIKDIYFSNNNGSIEHVCNL